MISRLWLHVALISAWVLAIPCAGQNLVPNPSFELYNSCPNGASGVDYSATYSSFPTVRSWVNPLQQGSADYFNSCAAANTYVSVPNNGFGYQAPHSGNAYVGIIAWEGTMQPSGHLKNDFAEYLQCKLTQPMVAGTRYCVNFYVHNAVSVKQYNYVGIDDIGVNFSATKTNAPTGLTLSMPNSVQNMTGKFLVDTADWIKLTMIYTATGGEEWMSVGWFDNGGVPGFSMVSPAVPNPALNYRCYLFLDDFSVTPLTNTDTFYTRHDSLYCKNLAANMTLKSPAQMADYAWSNGGTADKLQVTDTGIYWCVASTGCVTYIDTFVVKYLSTPKLDLGKEIINCENQPVTIASNVTASSYTWSTGAKTGNITVNKTGVYKLTLKDACGTQSDSVKVFIQPATPAPLAIDTMICQFAANPILTLEDSINITWYTHADGKIGSRIQPSIVTKYTGAYNLFITKTIGKCESEKVPAVVSIKYTPHEELGNKVVMCENDVQPIGKMDTGVIYRWNTGANTCCILPKKEGLYQRTTNNECGSYVDSVWVYHNSCEECVAFPNAFSPVKGMENDMFRPLLKCPVSEFKMNIFNRWGNLVFESNDIYKGWNGRYNYDWAPVGTYVYIVEYTAKGKLQKQRITGNVTLVR